MSKRAPALGRKVKPGPITHLRQPCGHCERFHPPARCRPVSGGALTASVFCWCMLWPEDPVPGTAVPLPATIPWGGA